MGVAVLAGGLDRSKLAFAVCFSVLLLASQRRVNATATPTIEPQALIGLGSLQRAELDPRGKYLASCSDSFLHIWHLNGTLKGALPALDGMPWAGFSWSPNGSMIAVANFRGRILVVRSETLSTLAEIEYDYHAYWGVGSKVNIIPWPLEWSPNASLIALGWCDGKAHIFDVSEKAHLFSLNETGFEAWVRNVDWSPDGGRFLRTGWDSTLVYNLSTGTLDLKLDQGEPVYGHDLASFSPAEPLIASLYQYTLKLYDSASGLLVDSVHVSMEADSLAWSPDGRLLAVGTSGGGILVFRRDGLGLVANVSAHFSPVVFLSWTGRLLASTSGDQTVKLWEVDSGSGAMRLLRTFSGWGLAVTSVQWYPDGQHILAACGTEDPVKVFGVDGSEKLRIPAQGLGFESATVSMDGKMIATASKREVSIWDARFGTLAGRLETTYDVEQIRWSPAKSNVLAVARWDGVDLWDVLNLDGGPLSRVVPESNMNVRCLAWSPDGGMLALGCLSTVEVWDPWRPVHLVSVPIWWYVLAVEWSPDGSKLACLAGYGPSFGEYDRQNPPPQQCRVIDELAELTVWSVQRSEGQLRLSVLGEALLPLSRLTPPGCFSWSPNSTVLVAATGSEREYFWDRLAEILERQCGVMMEPGLVFWQLVQGSMVPVLNLTGPVRPVSSVSWSPDGSMVAAGSDEGVIRIWRIPAGTVAERTGWVSLLCTLFLLVIGLLGQRRECRGDLVSNLSDAGSSDWMVCP